MLSIDTSEAPIQCPSIGAPLLLPHDSFRRVLPKAVISHGWGYVWVKLVIVGQRNAWCATKWRRYPNPAPPHPTPGGEYRPLHGRPCHRSRRLAKRCTRQVVCFWRLHLTRATIPTPSAVVLVCPAPPSHAPPPVSTRIPGGVPVLDPAPLHQFTLAKQTYAISGNLGVGLSQDGNGRRGYP